MKMIQTVGELISYLEKNFNKSAKIELEGTCDGGCCYHKGYLTVDGLKVLCQDCDDECPKEYLQTIV